MKPALVSVAFAAALAAAAPVAASALEVFPLKESDGVAEIGGACPLASNTNGTAANLRWYNVCSGYVWIFSDWAAGEGVGVLFGGPWQPSVRPDNHVRRVITYFRNVMANYQQTVDIFLDVDNQGDGCPDITLASDLGLDPGLRWNCSDFNAWIPWNVNYLIVRQVHGGGTTPSFATDGRKASDCSPTGPAQSFYYGVGGAACLPWDGPTARNDNFLTWLIVDGLPGTLPQACCFHTRPCEDLEPSLCVVRGGTPLPVGTLCAADADACAPTDVPAPNFAPATWGRVKTLYQ